MVEKPLVSIVLTLFNGEKFVGQSIESALAQTYTNWEMIIVNDASTDESLQVVSSFDDSRIRVISLQENGQLCNAHRVGDREARGRYMAVLDKDDLWMPDKLEKQVAYLEEHPETAACFTMMTFIDEYGNEQEDDELRSVFTAPNQSQSEWIHTLLTSGNHLCHPSAMVRMDALWEVGDYGLLYLQVQDYDLWLRLALKYNIYVFQEPLIQYRRFEESGSLSQKSEQNNRRVDFEYSWIVGQTVKDMDDNLFRKVFYGEMVNPEAETAEEILCEKALLLSSDILVTNCKQYAFELFSKIFQDPSLISVLKEKYGFDQHDVYRLTGQPIIYDRFIQLDHARQVTQLQEQAKQLQQQVTEYADLYRKAASDFAAIQGSFFWRLTGPARKMVIWLKNILSRHERLYMECRLLKCFLQHGWKETARRRRAYLKEMTEKQQRNNGYYLSREERKTQSGTHFPRDVKFSILVPLYNTPEKYLTAMIESVQNQTYENWELCLADGSDENNLSVGSICTKYAAQDSRIKYQKLVKNGGISENTNACLEMATGDYIGLFDHDDLLHPSALYEYMKMICEQDADFLYSDENTFHETPADAYWPHYKPDFAPDTLRSYNYICHFTVFKRTLLDQAGGGFRKQFDGSQDYDLILRLTEHAKHIVHVPRVLYYWRSHKQSTASDIAAKPYTVAAAKAALTEHLQRVGLKGEVLDSSIPSTYCIRYELNDQPLISIVIPNKDHIEDLAKCLDSIKKRSTYSNWEVIVVENNSTEQATFDYYRKIQRDSRIKVVTWIGEFNFSAINNFGVRYAKGAYLLLLNNDIEVITPDWLEQMLMFAQREDVGAVGAMLYYPDDTVQHAGVILGIGGVAGHAHKYFKKGEYGYASRMTIAQNLSAVTAACMLVSKSVWQEVDGLDESFAVAFNDVDLCMKIRKAGYLIVWTPYAELYHYESKSRGQEDNPEKQRRFKGEIDRFFEKWGQELADGDPYYNPNLTLEKEDFSFR